MKHYSLAFLFWLTACSALASETDTVFVGENIVYKVDGAQDGSQIIWKAAGADIISESGNSITLKFSKEGDYSLMVCEKNTAQCLGEFFSIDIFAKPKPDMTPEKPEPEEPKPNEPEPEEPQPDEPSDQPEETKIDFPNIFTPNNDGNNDLYHISYNKRPENFKIEIFSRSGKKVYSSTNPDFEWTGYNCNPDTYFYMCNYMSNGKPNALNGTILLAKER